MARTTKRKAIDQEEDDDFSATRPTKRPSKPAAAAAAKKLLLPSDDDENDDHDDDAEDQSDEEEDLGRQDSVRKLQHPEQRRWLQDVRDDIAADEQGMLGNIAQAESQATEQQAAFEDRMLVLAAELASKPSKAMRIQATNLIDRSAELLVIYADIDRVISSHEAAAEPLGATWQKDRLDTVATLAAGKRLAEQAQYAAEQNAEIEAGAEASEAGDGAAGLAAAWFGDQEKESDGAELDTVLRSVEKGIRKFAKVFPEEVEIL